MMFYRKAHTYEKVRKSCLEYADNQKVFASQGEQIIDQARKGRKVHQAKRDSFLSCCNIAGLPVFALRIRKTETNREKLNKIYCSLVYLKRNLCGSYELDIISVLNSRSTKNLNTVKYDLMFELQSFSRIAKSLSIQHR